MKIVAISDTHGLHNNLALGSGDILIHAGDVSNKGEKQEVKDFLGWCEKQDFVSKIFIAGNHDFFSKKNRTWKLKNLFLRGYSI